MARGRKSKVDLCIKKKIFNMFKQDILHSKLKFDKNLYQNISQEFAYAISPRAAHYVYNNNNITKTSQVDTGMQTSAQRCLYII